MEWSGSVGLSSIAGGMQTVSGCCVGQTERWEWSNCSGFENAYASGSTAARIGYYGSTVIGSRGGTKMRILIGGKIV